ncbi:MAG: PIN domain-containing protein [Planctomycetota bacterium]|jgi:hypothetical protein
MIVVPDTNVWISDLALTSNIGSAVRFFLKQNNARIGLPEVVRLETEFHLRTMLSEHIKKISDSHRQLLAVFGRLREVVLPKEEDIERLVVNVFGGLEVDVQEIPFTIESARSSLIRAVRRIPPSDKNQEFKDGVLWADCVKLLASESVFLVTNDKAFYEGRDPTKGLAAPLREEIREASSEFRIFPDLGGLLSEITVCVEIPQKTLIEAYMGVQRDKIENMASSHSFALTGEPSADVSIFVTEDPNVLFVNFAIEFTCSDTTDEGRTGAKITARGEGTYDTNSKRLTDLVSRGEELTYLLADGTEKTLANTVVGVGNIVLGHRVVEHSVRYKL